MFHKCYMNPEPKTLTLPRRIRKCWLNGAEVVVIGPQLDLTYPYLHAGEGAEALAAALQADSGVLAKLQAAERPAVLVGPGVLKRIDRGAVMQQVVPPHRK